MSLIPISQLTATPTYPQQPTPTQPTSKLAEIIISSRTKPTQSMKRKRSLCETATNSSVTNSSVTSIAKQAMGDESDTTLWKKQKRLESDSRTTSTTTPQSKSTSSQGLEEEEEIAQSIEEEEEIAQSIDQKGEIAQSIDEGEEIAQSILEILPPEIIVEILSKLPAESVNDILNFEAVAKIAQYYTQIFWQAHLAKICPFQHSLVFPLESGRACYLFSRCIADLAENLAGIQKIDNVKRSNILQKYSWLKERIPLLFGFLTYVTFQKVYPAARNIYFENVQNLLQQIDEHTWTPRSEFVKKEKANTHHVSLILTSIQHDDWKTALNMFMGLANSGNHLDKIVFRICTDQAITEQDKQSLGKVLEKKIKFHDYELATNIYSKVPGFFNAPCCREAFFQPVILLQKGIKECKREDYAAANKTFDLALSNIPTFARLGLFVLEHILMAKVMTSQKDQAAKFASRVKDLWRIPKIIPPKHFFKTQALLLQSYYLNNNLKEAEDLYDRFPPNMEILKWEKLYFTGAMIKANTKKFEKAEEILSSLISEVKKYYPDSSLKLLEYRFHLGLIKFDSRKFVESEQILNEIYSSIIRKRLTCEFYPKVLIFLAMVKKALYKYPEAYMFSRKAEDFYVQKYRTLLNNSALTWDECLAADKAGANEIPEQLQTLMSELDDEV